MEKLKVIETEGYKNEFVTREEKKKQKRLDFLDYSMLFVSVGIIVGVAFLIVGLV